MYVTLDESVYQVHTNINITVIIEFWLSWKLSDKWSAWHAKKWNVCVIGVLELGSQPLALCPSVQRCALKREEGMRAVESAATPDQLGSKCSAILVSLFDHHLYTYTTRCTCYMMLNEMRDCVVVASSLYCVPTCRMRQCRFLKDIPTHAHMAQRMVSEMRGPSFIAFCDEMLTLQSFICWFAVIDCLVVTLHRR